MLQYMLFDPTIASPCDKCNVLPLCMGGCPYKRIINNEKCSNYKYILEKCLKNAIAYFKKPKET